MIIGAGVGRGYLNNEELTNKNFRTIQVNGENVRAYFTGDLGFQREQGGFVCLGRIDRQVKIRGYRIELEEVECSIRRHPRVEECAVIVKERKDGDKKLIAYFSLTDGVVPVDELRIFLRMSVPEYMIPFSFVQMEQIPLTGNGKIDYQALPEYSKLRPHLSNSKVAPSTKTEKELSKIWSGLFDFEEGSIGVHDDFFNIGGDSLLAVELIVLLESAYNHEFAFNFVVNHPTIYEMSNAIIMLLEK